MKKNFKILAFLALLPVTCTTGAFAQDAGEILRTADEITYAPKDQEATTIITLTDKNGNKSVRKAEMKQKGKNLRLTRFTEPASQAGISFLSLPDDVMYIYLPAFGRERRIASHVKNQSFAGTDFSYEDMEAVPYSDKFDPLLLETTADRFILELTPKPGIRSDYGKLVMQIDRNLSLPVGIEFYNRGNQLAKRMDIEYEEVQGYLTQKRITMNDLNRNHSTVMEIEKIRFDNDLIDSEFTIRELKKL